MSESYFSQHSTRVERMRSYRFPLLTGHIWILGVALHFLKASDEKALPVFSLHQLTQDVSLIRRPRTGVHVRRLYSGELISLALKL